MVDAADPDKIEASRNELHNLLDKPQLLGIPVLVLGNKRDLPTCLDEKELIDRMWVDNYISFICHIKSLILFYPLVFVSGICVQFRTEKFAVTPFHVKRKTTLTSHSSGSLLTQNQGAARQEMWILLIDYIKCVKTWADPGPWPPCTAVTTFSCMAFSFSYTP